MLSADRSSIQILAHLAAGMKRSASGEAAAAAAKKQKTTPLAAYQQAQEHLKAQALQVCFVDMHSP